MRSMAAWVEETLPELTLKFAGLSASGRDASH